MGTLVLLAMESQPGYPSSKTYFYSKAVYKWKLFSLVVLSRKMKQTMTMTYGQQKLGIIRAYKRRMTATITKEELTAETRRKDKERTEQTNLFMNKTDDKRA